MTLLLLIVAESFLLKYTRATNKATVQINNSFFISICSNFCLIVFAARRSQGRARRLEREETATLRALD